MTLRLDWPEFPAPPESVTMDDADVVSMPLDYWLQIAEYRISVERVRGILGIVDGPVRVEVR